MTEKTKNATRRPKGDHSLTFDEKRQRWRARATIGYDSRGRRKEIVRFGKSKTAAASSLRNALKDKRLAADKSDEPTVGEAIDNWMTYGLPGRSPNTVKGYVSVIEGHIRPALGAIRLRELRTRDIEDLLAAMSVTVGRATLKKTRMILRRSLNRALAHDQIDRNVAEVCELPIGKSGRESKSFTAKQADAILRETAGHKMHAYIVVSMLTGARTEEMRALTWDHVTLNASGGVPPHIMVWRSTRRRGETKTQKSRRSLALPQLAVKVLRAHRKQQEEMAECPGWRHTGLVFTSSLGTEMDVNNVRRDFRSALRPIEGIEENEWTPRELRHSFVSLLSDSGVPLEEISRLVGHSGTSVTELVYRHQIRPVVQTGAEAMDQIFAKQNRQHRKNPEELA